MFKVPAVLVFALLTASICAVSPAAGASSSSCHHVAYVADYANQHYSLIKNNSTLYGSTLVIESNCEYQYYTNYSPILSSTQSSQILIFDDFTSLVIIQDNITYIYSDLLTFSSLDDFNYVYSDDDIVSVSPDSIWWDEILAHGITATILFILSTTLVYRFAEYRIDRNVEVVV